MSCVIAIGATTETSYAVKSDGSLWAWGYNGRGELGNGTVNVPVQVRVPQQVLNLGSGVTKIVGGLSHALALKADGAVWAWGYNNGGQLGDGTTTIRATPAPVSSLSNIIKVAAGVSHSLALRSDGVVFGWGADCEGQLGIGFHGCSNVLTPVQSVAQVTDLAAGYYHSMFLRTDGTVWTTGQGIGLGYPQPSPWGTPQQVTGIRFPCLSVAAGANLSFVRHARTPPYLDLQPLPQTCLAGGVMNLKTDPYGTPAITQNWFHNENNFIDDSRIQGALAPNLTVNPVLPQDAGAYYLRVENMQGVLNSNTVNVTVVPSPFCDDFTTGASSYWGHEVGNWTVSNGAYRSVGNTYSSLPFELADFAIDVDIVNMQTGVIYLRSSGTPLFGINAVYLYHTGGNLSWYWCVGGSCPGPFNTAANAYTVGANVHLRIEVTGNTYKAFVDGAAAPATQYTDNHYASGRVALNDYSGPSQAYDRVCVSSSGNLPPDGDFTNDGIVDGDDIQPFYDAINAGATDPASLRHGDFNGNGVIDAGDTAAFVALLRGP